MKKKDSLKERQKKTMNLIYEHQMIQAIAYIEGKNNLMTHDLLVMHQGNLELVDYCCLKNKYFVLNPRSRFNSSRMENAHFQSIKALEL